MHWMYVVKWSRFSKWVNEWGIFPSSAPLHLILDYLLSLRAQGLAPASVRVQLVAISAFHPPVQGHLVFSHSLTACFLNGLDHSFPYAR